MIQWRSGRGSRPTWNAFHIDSKHTQQEWDHYYMPRMRKMGSSLPLHPHLLAKKSWGNLLKPCITPWPQMIQWRSGRGSTPTWNESQKHLQTVWDLQYAVDGHWDPSLYHYIHTHWARDSRFRKCAESCITHWPQMIQWWCDRGSKPTWNASHIVSRHILAIWDQSYAMDGQWDPSSCHTFTLSA